MLQRRLTELGYWDGDPVGQFGLLTMHAVIAAQKAAGLSRDGVVGPLTEAALERGVRPNARSSSGVVLEIDLTRQLLLYAVDGTPRWVFSVSTGSGGTYWMRGTARLAVTPVGVFRLYREVNGSDVSPLGVLWRPKYFVGGVAIHGYYSVPAYPASHGCVRVSNAAMDFIWQDGLAPLGTTVWVYR